MKIIITEESFSYDGTMPEIMAGFTNALKTMREEGDITKEDIDRCHDLALMSDKELESHMEKKKNKFKFMANFVNENIDEIFEMLNNGKSIDEITNIMVDRIGKEEK